MKKTTIMLVTVLFMIIGYAAYNATVNIYGLGKISENISDFKVYLDNLNVNDKEVEGINDAKDEFTIDNVNGKISVDIVNDSTEYDTESYLECESNVTPDKTEWTFDYTGAEQTFTAPITGTYKLETWGAQGGGNSTYIGGYGSYSIGNTTLSVGQIIYLNVGGKGDYCSGNLCTTKATYNGGGSCKTLSYDKAGAVSTCGSGGGATHVAMTAGLLSTLENKKDYILIASGGGGGSNYCNDWNYANGGHAGGYIGVSSINTGAKDFSKNGGSNAQGGTQNSGYAFGIGGTFLTGYDANVGGGGGFYGGKKSGINGAGGGSGYIGNTLLTEKSMYCYNCSESSEESTKTVSTTCTSATPTENCAKVGNGYARITLTSSNETKKTSVEPVTIEAQDRRTIALENINTSNMTCKLKVNKISRTNKVKSNIASAPELSDGLIPVTIKDNGEVTYADITKEWYSYEDKVWANAVILENNANYKVGDTIKESDIQSYFVWIPRYRYKLFNVDNYSLTTETSASEVESKAQEIEIEFERKSQKISNGSKNGEWLTHPAFTSFDTNGFWVGKFETGYKGATTTSSAQVNSNDTSKVTIKPNIYSWRGINVKNIFETSYNYKRNLDSHMMKNTEWGAVAYLSHSKYGIDKEVNINNNSLYKTGYSSLPTLDQSSNPGTSGDGENYNQPYNTSIGYLASTTGNISGVYDMSGGAWEYTSSYISGNVGSSGFTTATLANYDTKYFDLYNASSSVSSYQYRILGDATGEMGPFYNYKENDDVSYYHNSWYNDYSLFIDSSNPWLVRSCHYSHGILTSQFSFSMNPGVAGSYLSSRIVLTP